MRSRTFLLKYVPNKTRTKPRLSVIVSKKVAKSAVKRNLIRRRLYEILRQLLPEFNQPVDLAVIVNQVEILEIDYEELTIRVKDLLASADLLKK